MLWKTLSTAALTLGLSLSFAGGEVALTIDDMPFLGSAGKNEGKLRREAKRFRMVLDILKEEKVPAAGFVVAGTIEPGQWALLEEWHNSGNIIANHTYSHPRLSSSNTQKYIDNVAKADKILAPLMQRPKYFRYPFLSTGRNAEQKQTVRDYLAQQNYIIAPVTIDSKDFRFNARLMNIHWRKRKAYLPGIRRQYIGYIWSQTRRAEKKAQKKMGRPIKHILLIHMNVLNANSLRELIQMYRDKGYRFITLTEAMKDPYYQDKAAGVGETSYGAKSEPASP